MLELYEILAELEIEFYTLSKKAQGLIITLRERVKSYEAIHFQIKDARFAFPEGSREVLFLEIAEQEIIRRIEKLLQKIYREM